MASNSSAQPPFNPLNQPFFILAADGKTKIPFSTGYVTEIYTDATSLSINYGTQIGACFVMLAVVLAMTPRVRFRRIPTLISVAALTLNLMRMIILAWFFTSSWVNFYTIATGGSTQFVPQSEINASVLGTVLSIPITILILAALSYQAWSVIQLWPLRYKLPVAALSLALVLLTIGFNFATTIIQARGTVTANPSAELNNEWVRETYLGLITASISWLCFLFNIRLVMHMWTNRSVLPSLKGLKAMDVLVITNGILMFVPVVFAALEFPQWSNFEGGALTQTSVIIVLPLGTLVAQRLANPAWFGSTDGGNSGADSSFRHHHPGDGVGPGGGGVGGAGASHSTGTTSVLSTDPRSGMGSSGTQKRPLLKGFGTGGSGNGGGGGGGGVPRGNAGGAVMTHIASDGSAVSEKGQAVHADNHEVGDLERGNQYLGGGEDGRGRGGIGGDGVRVDYGFERSEERVPTGGS